MNQLPLPELNLVNYRLFSQLNLSELRPVNLIVGPNNTGKSSLLEAIYISQSPQPLAALFDVLQERGEVVYDNESAKIQGYRAESVFKQGEQTDKTPSINRLRFMTEMPNYRFGYAAVFGVQNDEQAFIIPEMGVLSSDLLNGGFEGRYRYINEGVRFINAYSLTFAELAHLWNQVFLHPAEDRVIQILQLIEPRVERIGFTSTPNVSGGVRVRLKNQREPVPLGSLGDGMRRLLTLAITLASLDPGGILLIDEIDTGFYYDVLPQMWQMILEAAQTQQVQVFATTHSWDCVKAFGEGLTEMPSDLGQLIRLEPKADASGINAVTYSAEELHTALEHNIEVR